MFDPTDPPSIRPATAAEVRRWITLATVAAVVAGVVLHEALLTIPPLLW